MTNPTQTQPKPNIIPTYPAATKQSKSTCSPSQVISQAVIFSSTGKDLKSCHQLPGPQKSSLELAKTGNTKKNSSKQTQTQTALQNSSNAHAANRCCTKCIANLKSLQLKSCLCQVLKSSVWQHTCLYIHLLPQKKGTCLSHILFCIHPIAGKAQQHSNHGVPKWQLVFTKFFHTPFASTGKQ